MIVDKILLMASAIIKNEKGEILILERGETKTFQKHWQIPEGKLEEREKPTDAIKRELMEELNATVETINFETISQNTFEINNTKYLTIRTIFSVTLKTNEITLSEEHSDYKWIDPKEVKNLQLVPGTLEAID